MRPNAEHGEDRPPQAMRPPERGTPFVSYTVIGVSVAMFFLLDSVLPTPIPRLQPGALYGPLVQRGQYWRALSYAVEHGSLMHLGFNLWVVWALGRTLEVLIGSRRFLLISAVTCLGSAAVVLWLGFEYPTVGASGMILGWAGAMLPVLTREGRRTLWTGLLLPTLAITVLPLLVRGAGMPPVSWQGHLGGFLFGVLCGFALRTGPRRFALLGPILLFVSAVAVVVAAHPEKLHP